MRRWTCLFTLALVCCGPLSCAHVPAAAGPLPGSAAALYVQGVEDLAAGLYPEATRALEEIKTKHPYSRYAALADLRLGDAHMRRGRWIEAVETFRSFTKYHPNHVDAPYAAFQAGEGHFAQLGADWWFLPPSAEKDQAVLRQAIAAYEDLLARFSTGPLAATARDHLRQCRRRLADHEMYVAHFYFRRDRYRAAAQRAEALLTAYPDVGLDREALWLVGRSRYLLGELDEARPALERLRATHPDSRQGHDAAALLAAWPSAS